MIAMEDFSVLIEALKSAKHVGVLTGAGISTLSNIPDFRGAKGMYNDPAAMRIFDIDWFDRDPSIYYKGCRELIYGLHSYEPNIVHYALKRLEDLGIVKGIATQNIDMLHHKAGSKNVWEVHGSPRVHHCRWCGKAVGFDEVVRIVESGADVARCSCGGPYKPDVTFFGEMLPEAEYAAAHELAVKSDVYLVLGTSLTVYPVAGLPSLTLQHGGKVFVVNATPTSIDDRAAGRWTDLKAFATAIMDAFPALA